MLAGAVVSPNLELYLLRWPESLKLFYGSHKYIKDQVSVGRDDLVTA